MSFSAPVFHDSTIQKCGTSGLSIYGKSNASFERCKVMDNMNFGCQIFEQDTTATFTDSIFTNNLHSVSIMAINASTVICEKCIFSNSLQPHVEVRSGSTVQLTKCDVSKSTQGVGLQVHNDGVLCINNTVIRDEAKMGVLVGDTGLLQITGGEIRNCGIAGIVCMANGNIQAEKTKLSGNGQFAIQFMEKSAGTVKSCEIENHTMFGILVSRDAAVTCDDNKFSNNGHKDIVNL